MTCRKPNDSEFIMAILINLLINDEGITDSRLKTVKKSIDRASKKVIAISQSTYDGSKRTIITIQRLMEIIRDINKDVDYSISAIGFINAIKMFNPEYLDIFNFNEAHIDKLNELTSTEQRNGFRSIKYFNRIKSRIDECVEAVNNTSEEEYRTILTEFRNAKVIN